MMWSSGDRSSRSSGLMGWRPDTSKETFRLGFLSVLVNEAHSQVDRCSDVVKGILQYTTYTY